MSDAGNCRGCGKPMPLEAGSALCPECVAAATVEVSAGIPCPAAGQPNRSFSGAGAGAEVEHPRIVGPYRIERLLAEGGFGEVYLAHQEKPLRRIVALKILKKGMDTRRIVARFRTEEHALALMNHESIAKVYDAGETEDGRPYFAMEYVEGSAITRFCDENPLSFDEVLELFRGVCLAVHHAHQKGIIHRDLKPSNVMVTMVDGRPVPKVIDFGIAKATQELVGKTILTIANEVVGTPEYMSPEQSESDGLDVDTRTDIYSLGILLYEMLTGSPPFVRQKSIEELRKSVLFDDPPKPTLKLRTGSERFRHFALMRNMDPAALRRRVKGDLNSIVMKAIDKDRERRYASAAGMAEDLRCFLCNEPVKARPPSFLYQAGKYVRRHRVGVMVASVLGLSLVGILVASIQISRRSAASTAYQRLIAAAPEGVPTMLEQTDDYLGTLAEDLRALADDPEGGSREWLRANLALLPVEPSRLEAIGERVGELSPEEIGLALRRAGERGRELVPGAVALLARFGERPAVRLRAAAVVAGCDPGNTELSSRAGDLVDWLILEGPESIATWRELFRPVATDLIPRLEEFYLYESGGSSQEIAAMFLADYHAGDLPALVRLVKVARPRQMPYLLKRLEAIGGEPVEALREAFAKSFESEESESLKEERADQLACLGVALIKLGEAQLVWPHLHHDGVDEDPRLRTRLIHAMAGYSVDPILLIRRFTEDRDVSIRRAGLMALGGYGQLAVAPGLREDLKGHLEEAFRSDPDPGIHSLAEWLLTKWGYRPSVDRMKRTMQRSPLDQPAMPPEGARFYLTSQGHTMIVLAGPVQFEMGSAVGDPMGEADEIRHRRRIPRTFAICSQHVRIGQFQEFERDESPERWDPTRIQADPDLPAENVRSSLALEYCNWLSRKEGIPEDQWCYVRPEDGSYLMAAADSVARTGYRLPTEAEWEFACRAGAGTRYPWGNSDEFSRHHAWTSLNSKSRSHPVGLLCPNDFGFFDMLGSLPQWCQEYYAPYPETEPGRVLVDLGIRGDRAPRFFLQRGGHYLAPPARSAQRMRVERESDMDRRQNSFRVARTLRTHDN